MMEFGFKLREACDRARTGFPGFSADTEAKESEGTGFLLWVNALPITFATS